MEYKIDDVAKLFETTSFTIYSYITKYPELRKTLKAKSGVLTINDAGIELLQKCIKGDIPLEQNEKDFRNPEIYTEKDPNVVVKSGESDPEPLAGPSKDPRENASSCSPDPDDAAEPAQSTHSYSSVGDFQKKVPPKAPSNELGMTDLTYREMKESIMHLREQIEIKDRQINDLNRLLENNQILLKQEQLNFKSLEQYLTGKK